MADREPSLAARDGEVCLTGSMRSQGGTRKAVRASLDMLGVSWNEHRGLLTSIFVIRGTEAQWRDIERWAHDNGIPVTDRAC